MFRLLVYHINPLEGISELDILLENYNVSVLSHLGWHIPNQDGTNKSKIKTKIRKLLNTASTNQTDGYVGLKPKDTGCNECWDECAKIGMNNNNIVMSSRLK